ncbi:DUF3857 domain-containing protein [Flavobacterium sp.]|uniref:DUF3857 domain-containing protein n=1 Tax=Flavobacterium sp. TaxID=239 RepID=UPI00391C0DED
MMQTLWWKSVNRNFLLLGITILSVNSINAQTNFETYKKEYPDYNELIVNNSTSYSISLVDKKLKVLQDNQYESIILSENGIQNNKETFTYSDFVKLLSYDAYTIVQDKGRDRKIKVTQAMEKQSQNGSVFHDDIKIKQLVFPNLESGAKKLYKYSTEFTDPNLLHKFIFSDVLPTKNATIEIKTDKSINIGFVIFNDPNHAIEFNKIDKKDSYIYQWTLKDSKPIKFEQSSPGYLYRVPHIVFYIKDFTIDNKKTELLGDIQRMYDYNSGFVKDLNLVEDEALKNQTLSIIENKKTDEEKLKAIFYWVKDNVKYIAFENGYEGFIPRQASLVYERKFGDCKDMASIITSMAKYANIPNVYLAWIGSRNLPYSFSQIATSAAIDHMIAVYKKGTEYIFLDATDQETQYGIPTAFIQEKEALLYNGDKFQIVKVPVTNAEKNAIKDSVLLTIKNDKIIGTGHLEIEGYNRTNTLNQIGDSSNKTKFEKIKSLVLKGNNKFNLYDFCEDNIRERDKPYDVHYDFDIDNYIIKVDKELYINLMFDKYYEKSTIEKDRESSFDFDYLSKFYSFVECIIPQNCQVKYIPKNVDLENELLKVKIEYQQKNNSIVMQSTIELKKIILEVTDFPLWNETIKKLKSNYSETIILKEK